MQVLSGRYGPYVKHGKINATLPKDRNPEEVTLAEAIELIAARAAKGPAKKPARKTKKTKKEKEKEIVEEAAELSFSQRSPTRARTIPWPRRRPLPKPKKWESFPPNKRSWIFCKARATTPASERSRAPSASRAVTASP